MPRENDDDVKMDRQPMADGPLDVCLQSIART